MAPSVAPLDTTLIRQAHRWRSVSLWAPCVVSAIAMLVIAVVGVRGADYPAHLLRAELWERAGFTAWNLHWYAGHSTPTYSLFVPPIVALVGPFAVIAVASVVATWCFSAITSDLLPGRATLTNIVFAVCFVPNAIVGRAPFALGFAVALVAAWAWHRGRPVVTVVAAVATTLCSPVAGVFLVLAATAVTLDRAPRARRALPPYSSEASDRAGVAWAAVVTTAAAAPLGVLALTFGSAGRFPFRFDHLAFSLVVAGLIAVLVPIRVVRIGVVLTVVASLVAYAIPNPLGGNFVRFTHHVGVPLVAYGLSGVGRRARAPLGAVTAVAIGWSLSAGVVAAAQWSGDESVEREYHRPLVEEVQRRNSDGRPLGRLEIPFTDGHWESYYVALEVPSARGWERQIDLEVNAELYDPDLDLADYRDWLDRNAVRWIAVADVAVDEGGLAEWELLHLEARGIDIPWLDRVWSNEHWVLYEVESYEPIIDPPATLVRQGTDDLEVSTPAPSTVTIRYTYTEAMAIDGSSCVEESEDGWTRLRLTTAGTHRIAIDPDASLVPGPADACDP